MIDVYVSLQVGACHVIFLAPWPPMNLSSHSSKYTAKKKLGSRTSHSLDDIFEGECRTNSFEWALKSVPFDQGLFLLPVIKKHTRKGKESYVLSLTKLERHSS